MRLFSPFSSLAAMVLALFGASLRADSSSSRHPTPTPPNPDLVALKDSIAALTTGPVHDLSDSISKTNTRLDLLERDVKRVGVSLDGVDLVKWGRDQTAEKAAVGDLVGKSDALDQQMQELGARLDRAAAEAAKDEKELKTALSSGGAQLAALEQDERQWHDLWPKELAAQYRAATALQRHDQDLSRWAEELAGAAMAFLIIGSALLQSRGRRRREREILQSIARLGAEFRQGLAAASAARAEASGTDWQAIEGRLDQLARRWENAAAPTERITQSAQHHSWSHSSAATLSPSEKPTVSVSAMPEPTVASRLLWPAEFLDPESPLSRWRFLLESHFDDEEHPALPVLAGLLGLRAAVDRPTVTSAEIAAAAFRLSEALHAYWQSLTDLSAEDRQQASAAWIRSIRQLVAQAAPRVELREVMPGSRVDPDLMHATEERSGNHLNVAEVHSWAVVDRSGDRPKVLHRAQIAST